MTDPEKIAALEKALLHQTLRGHDFTVLCSECNSAAVLLDESRTYISQDEVDFLGSLSTTAKTMTRETLSQINQLPQRVRHNLPEFEDRSRD